MPVYNASIVVPPARSFRRDLPTLSPSKVADLECPKRFGAKHIEKILPAEPWSHTLTYGNGLHKLMYLLYKPGGVAVRQRDITALAHTAFAAQKYSNDEAHRRKTDIAKATQTAARYLLQDADTENTVQAETFENVVFGQAKCEPIKLSTRFDRLVIRPDEPHILRIIDYKTGNHKGETDFGSAMLTLAIAKQLPGEPFAGREPLLCFDFVDETGLAHREEVTVKQARDLWKPVHKAASAVFYGGERGAVPGPQCQFCPLRTECRPDHEVEDALTEDPFAE